MAHRSQKKRLDSVCNPDHVRVRVCVGVWLQVGLDCEGMVTL